MRAFFTERALPFALLFVALVVANGLGVALVFAHGFAFSMGLWGLLLQIPVTTALALAVFAILTRIKEVPPERVGLSFDRRALRQLSLSTIASVLLIGAATLLLAGVGLLDLRLAPGASLATVPVLLVGLLASWVNALLQQLGLQGIAQALGPDRSVSFPAVGFSVLLFVGTHASESQAPIYLANVALFAVLTSILFHRGPRPSYGAAVGLHGGWNAAMVFLGLIPGGEELALFRAEGRDVLFSGGAAGLESGLAYGVLLVVVIGALGVSSRQASGGRASTRP